MLPTRLVLSRSSTLGWIGLGAMGNPMATHLFTKATKSAKGSHEMPSMVVCDPSEAAVARFVENVRKESGDAAAERIKRVSSPKDVSAAAARVFTMVPSTPQVEEVYLGENGLVVGLNGADTTSLTKAATELPWLVDGKIVSGTTDASTLFVDQTTLDPNGAKRVADAVHDRTGRKALMIDGPVSGGVKGATDGTLTIMYGSADPVASELAVPLLQHEARPGGVVHCGNSGSGVAVKVVNNLILSINQIALSEALALAKALDIDPKLMHDIINTSTGQSWSSKVNSPLAEVEGSPGARGYTGGFVTRLMLKDVGLALTAAAAKEQPMPLTWGAKSLYEAVCQEGDGSMANKDFSVIYQWLLNKRAQGVEVGFKNGGPGDK